jgi:threonine synthase
MKLICQSCNKRYLPSEPVWNCTCGGLLTLDFHARFPLKKIQKRKPNLWRYREALPIENDKHIISFDEGFTPLVQEEFSGKKVFLKQDHLFPSGSFKDRGATVLISKVHELRINNVIEDSSGNAGAAIAAYCAKANITCDVYVPEKTSQGKLTQIQQYGAILHRIPGSREDTAAAALKRAQTTYYASHYWNPFFFHGTKTCIIEIVEQLGWKAPDSIIIPVGNGTLLLGMYIGLQELYKEKIIDSFPKIIAVQAENCSPLAQAWKKHHKTKRPHILKETIAEGIAISNPVRATEMLSAITETNGDIITVSEQEIIDSLHQIHQKGHYIEPTSAVALAGFRKYHMKQDELVVIPLTGHGLKANETFRIIK